MTTIPQHITQQAIETARAYNRDWENGVEIIEQALLAAEKRGLEEERERWQAKERNRVCENCHGRGWLTHSPYGDRLPCSECGGIGRVRSTN